MHRRNVSLTVAICMSLCLHAWAIHALIIADDQQVQQQGWSLAHPKQIQPRIVRLVDQPKPPMPAPIPPPPPPSEAEQKFGQADGRGTAINSSAGLTPMQARKAPENQAMLSRNPGQRTSGTDKRILAELLNRPATPLESSLPNLTEQHVAAQQRASADIPPIINSNASPLPGGPKPPAVAPKPKLQAVAKAAPHRAPRRAVVKQQPRQIAAASSEIKSDATDPGQFSESESDAFSDVGTLVFRNGRLEARFGRKIRTVRPRFTISGQLDLATFVNPTVQLIVHADASGKPTLVEIIRSSGSTNIDEPVRLALYQWWFEPPKDKNGKPMPDVMLWTIDFRN